MAPPRRRRPPRNTPQQQATAAGHTPAQEREMERRRAWLWLTLVVVMAPAMHHFLVSNGLAVEVGKLKNPFDPFELLKLLLAEKRKGAQSRLDLTGISLALMTQAFDGRNVPAHNVKSKLLTDFSFIYNAWATLAVAMKDARAEAAVRRHWASALSPARHYPPSEGTREERILLLGLSSLFDQMASSVKVFLDNNQRLGQQLAATGQPDDPREMFHIIIREKKVHRATFLQGVSPAQLERCLFGGNKLCHAQVADFSMKFNGFYNSCIGLANAINAAAASSRLAQDQRTASTII